MARRVRLKKQLIPREQLPPDEEYRALHELADVEGPEIQSQLLSGVDRFKGTIVLAELTRRLEIGDVGGALRVIPWGEFEENFKEIDPVFARVVGNAKSVSEPFLPTAIRADLDFQMLNPRAVDFVRSHTAELVTQVTDETQEAIRGVIDRAFTDGMPPRRSAQHIRELVGLTDRQATAVDNLRRRLRADDLPWPEVERQTQAYADRLLRHRSENIARTETLRASNMGQELLWLDARDQGLISDADARRVWIVTPDDRLCEFCEPMDGQTRRLEEEFVSPEGLSPVLTPPLHPSCRCALGLVFLNS